MLAGRAIPIIAGILAAASAVLAGLVFLYERKSRRRPHAAAVDPNALILIGFLIIALLGCSVLIFLLLT